MYSVILISLKEDYTALMEAVKLLLSAGASLDEKDSVSTSVLYYIS